VEWSKECGRQTKTFEAQQQLTQRLFRVIVGHTNRIASSPPYIYILTLPSPLHHFPPFLPQPPYYYTSLPFQWLILAQPPLPPECGAPSRNGFSCMRPCWPCSLATPDSTSSQELPLTWALANSFSQSTATLLPYSCSFLLPTSWKS